MWIKLDTGDWTEWSESPISRIQYIMIYNGMDPMSAFIKSADGNAPSVYQGILNR